MIERLKALTTDELDRSAEKLVRLEKRNVALLGVLTLASVALRVEVDEVYRDDLEDCS